MFGEPFKTNSFRNVIIQFGTLFNNLSVQRIKADGTVDKIIKIPIQYAQRAYWVNRLEFNNNDEEHYDGFETHTPRLSFNLVSFQRDAIRQLAPMEKLIYKSPTTGETSYQMMRIPYQFIFELDITTEYLEDYYQILEQILPYFSPGFSITVHDNKLGIKTDLNVILDSERTTSPVEQDMNSTRKIEGTLVFQIQGFLYHNTPSQSNTKLIETAYINYHLQDAAGTVVTTKLQVTDPEHFDIKDKSTWNHSVSIHIGEDTTGLNPPQNQPFGPYTDHSYATTTPHP